MTADNLPPLEALQRIMDMCGVAGRCACGRPNGLPAIVACARAAIAAHEAAKAQPVSDFIAKQHRLPAEAERIIADNMSMEPKQ